MAREKVAEVSEVAPGTARVVQVGGRPVALFNVDGTFHAIDNTCPHRGGPLAEGPLEGTTVRCPWHGWGFDVMTGECQINPAVKQVRYPVAVEGNDVFIDV